MVKKRRRHSEAYKLQIALEALEGSKTISLLSSEHEIHANLIRAWKRQLFEDRPSVFATNGEPKHREQEAQEAELYEQIGRLKMELECLKKGTISNFTQRRLKASNVCVIGLCFGGWLSRWGSLHQSRRGSDSKEG